MKIRPHKVVGPVAVVGAVLAILGVAAMVSRAFFEGAVVQAPPRPPTARAERAAAEAGQFRVAEVEGPVEAFQGGQWYVVQAGDRVSLKDIIRVPRGARALLRRGGTEVEVQENGDFRLESVLAESASFGVLRGGRVVANVGAEGESLEITARETRSVNQGPARWVVSQLPGGQVSVRAARGSVRFGAQGKEVRVAQGTESTAQPGQPPSDPEPIPVDILLSVIWPEIDREAETVQVKGKAAASSRVTVNGRETTVAADGTFSVPVKVGPSPSRIDVIAEDPLGQKKAATRVLERPERAPVLETSEEDLWKQ